MLPQDSPSDGDVRPRVSVVIACWNERTFIQNAVHALLRGSEPNIEVLIVDGDSTDGTSEELRHLATLDERVVLLRNPARITPVAFNLGALRARGEFIAICGAHSVPEADWVERNLAALAEHPEAIAVGGVLETVSQTAIGHVIASVMSSRFGVGNARFRTGGRAGWVDTVVFGCYRREAFRYGLFDEDLATNQDDGFNTRLLGRGERLWLDPSIRCRYFCRPTWVGMLQQYWRYGRHKVSVFRKAGRIGSLRQLAPAGWVAFLAAALVARAGTPVIAAYVVIGLLASIGALRELGIKTALFLPVAASLHLAYGFGFWVGLLRMGV